MKNLLLFLGLLLTFSVLSTATTQAQTKDDLVQCLSLILELPEMEEVYQNDVSSGQTAILRKVESSFQPITKLMRQISTEDFYDLYNTVEVWEVHEITNHNIPMEYTLSYNFNFDPDEQKMQIQMWTDLNEDRRTTIMGRFQLLKNDSEEWEMSKQTVEKTPSRARPPSQRSRN